MLESLAALQHQLHGTYFQTELFETANREGGRLSQIKNCENLTTKREIGQIFIAGIRKLKCKFRKKYEIAEM
jgi:hypothetical protein